MEKRTHWSSRLESIGAAATAADLPKLYSQSDVARQLGVSPQTIAERADRIGVGRHTECGRLRFFLAGDIERLRASARPVGNPNWRRIPSAESTSEE